MEKNHASTDVGVVFVLFWLWACISLYAQDLPRFREHVITNELKFGYQLVAADLNGDGKKDLIAVDEAATELVWFENQHPAWKRHVLAVDVPRPLNADCWDVDGDGVPEVVLAYRFEPSPERSVGNVVLLNSGADVRQPWTGAKIDRVPTAHRVRWIDPEGNGKKVLLVAPMVGRRYPPASTIRCRSISTGPASGNERRSPASRGESCTRSTRSVGMAVPRQQLLTASLPGAAPVRVDAAASGSRRRSPRAIPGPAPSAAAARSAWATSGRTAFWPPSSRGTETRWWSMCRTESSGSAW